MGPGNFILFLLEILLCKIGYHRSVKTHQGEIVNKATRAEGVAVVETCSTCKKQQGLLHWAKGPQVSDPVYLIEMGFVKPIKPPTRTFKQAEFN